jgi:PAS domain S-box-containing protein
MDPDGSITGWNPQAERTFGWTAAEVMGRTLCDTVVAPACRADHEHGVEHFLTTAQGTSMLNRAIELLAIHRDGHEFPVEATVWPIRVGGGSSFNAFVRDISERRHAEDARRKEATLFQLLHSLTVAANRSSSIEHTAQTCISRICAYMGWPVGHVYLRANNSAEEPASTGLWSAAEDARFEAFREASERDQFVDGTGLPGRVLASRRPQWIVNLADEKPLSERTRAALKAGLRSGFGFPMLVEEKIIGVLEFFSLQTAPPDEAFLAMMGPIGSQLGQVIIRQRA